MPHAHAAAVVDRLLRRLASDARRLELPPHVDDDLKHVGRTLSRLQDVLVSLDPRSGAQEWMGEIKQVAYDVEDLLDQFEVEDHNSIKSQTSGCIAEVLCSIALASAFALIYFPSRGFFEIYIYIYIYIYKLMNMNTSANY
jgi:hypothetical protein